MGLYVAIGQMKAQHKQVIQYSTEGNQATLTHYIDDDDQTPCDWCGEADSDILYELI